MKKTIGKFTYQVAKMRKSDDMPFSPFIHICLRSWSTGARDVPCISPQLMTDGEIDAHIKLLKDDLDSVAREAKAELAKAKDSTLQIVSDRRADRSEPNDDAAS